MIHGCPIFVKDLVYNNLFNQKTMIARSILAFRLKNPHLMLRSGVFVFIPWLPRDWGQRIVDSSA